MSKQQDTQLVVFGFVAVAAVFVGILVLIQMHKEANDPLNVELKRLQQENAAARANHDAKVDSDVAIIRSLVQQYQRNHDIADFEEAKTQYENDPEHPLKNDFIMYKMQHKQ